MAYMNQEKKKKIAEAIKTILPNGWKVSLSVRNLNTIVCHILTAPVDLIAEMQAAREHQPYWKEHRNSKHFTIDQSEVQSIHHHGFDNQFSDSLPVIQAIVDALNLDNHDDSDVQTDYFDICHYVSLNVGHPNHPFTMFAPKKTKSNRK